MPAIENYKNAKIIIINDNSPEIEMKHITKSKEKMAKKYKLQNISNEGFVKSVNTAYQYAKNDDIILLNNDVILPKDWLYYLAFEAYTEKIGTVTHYQIIQQFALFQIFFKTIKTF